MQYIVHDNDNDGTVGGASACQHRPSAGMIFLDYSLFGRAGVGSASE